MLSIQNNNDIFEGIKHQLYIKYIYTLWIASKFLIGKKSKILTSQHV